MDLTDLDAVVISHRHGDHTGWQVAAVAPGHCTGEPGFAALSRVFGGNYLYAGVGTTLRL